MLQTAEKVEEKNWVICLVSIFPLWVLELSKVFLQFCANPSKKFKSIKAICIYASERSRYALSENGNPILFIHFFRSNCM